MELPALLRRAREGREDAVLELSRRFMSGVFARILGELTPVLRRKLEAMDCDQTVFAEVLRELPACDALDENAFRDWLYVKVQVRVMSRLRGERRKRAARTTTVMRGADPGAAAPDLTSLTVPGTRIGDYVVVRRLGEGGMGHVLLAHDPALDRDVALKFLHDRLLADARARRYFVREARALAEIRDPRVVAVHAVGEWEGRPYLAMEFVAGRSLESAGRGLPIAAILRIAEDLAAALAAAHVRRIVHRDVNPRNVVLRQADGTACLIDFGLARSLDRTTDWSGLVAGTPLYMAPEQVSNAPHDLRVDVYGFGATVFELLTGRVPHEHAEAASLFHAVLHDDAPLLRTLRPDAPRALEVLIARALARAPELRHADGTALLDDVRRVRRSLEGGDAAAMATVVTHDASPPHDPSEELPLLGREAEYRAAVAPLADVPAQRGRLVLVEGASGAGKSRLLRDVERAARAAGLDVIRSSGTETSGGPESAFRGALTDWAEAAGVGDAAALVRDASPAGGALAPALAWWLAGAHDAPAAPSRATVARALQILVATLVARRPALLAIDDLHLFDDGSLGLVATLAEAAASMPLLVLASHRPPETLAPAVPFVAQAPRLRAVRGAVRVVLGPLDERAVASMIRHVLRIGESEAARLAPVLHKRSAGNPLYLGETLRLLLEEGHVADAGTGEPRVLKRLSQLRIPPRLLELALRRVAGLPEEERDALGVVAIDPEGVSASVVAECRGAPRLAALRVLQQLVRARGLVREQAGSYVIAHAEIREAIYQDLIPELRAAYHDRAASELLAAAGGSVEPGRLGHHLRLAGRTDEAVEPLLRSAESAYRRHSPAEALELFDQTLACAGAAGSVSASLGRARCLAQLGDLAGARAAFETLALEPGDPGGVALLRWANFERQRGHPRRALEILERESRLACSDEVRARLVTLRADVASELDSSDLALLDLATATRLAAGGSDVLLAELSAAQGSVMWRIGRLEEAHRSWSDALERYERLGLSHETAIAMMHNLSLVSEDMGARQDALDFNGRAVERAALIGNDRTLVFTLIHRADLLVREMRLAEAGAALARAAGGLERLDNAEARVVFAAQEAELALALGDAPAALSAADRGLAASDEFARHAAGLRLLRARALLDLRRAEEALADARAARAAFAAVELSADGEEALAYAARALRVLGLQGAERAELAALADVVTLAAALERAASAGDAAQRASWLARAAGLATDARARREIELVTQE